MAIEVRDVKVDVTYATQEVYFSGGLRGLLTDGGWALCPVSEDPDSDALLFRTAQDHFRFATSECGLRLIGTCVRYEVGEHSPPMDAWEPGRRDPSNNLHATDSWSAVRHNAQNAGDADYGRCAAHLSISLKLAGLRLRDVSRKYQDQLRWALRAAKPAGTWFSNAALLDLYADFHSLASELSSSRDHLARLAALHVGAPPKIDSLARLEEWLAKTSNRTHIGQPLVALMLSASGTEERPEWLRRLGEIRNEMLHKVPMGSNERVSGLTLEESATRLGPIKRIRLAEPLSRTPLAEQGPDPLIELSEISERMEHLCRAGWKLARYPATLPTLVEAPASGKLTEPRPRT